MTIYLTVEEISRRGFTPASWAEASFDERRNLASEILRGRPGAVDQRNARMIEFRNPHFNDFVLVTEAQTESPPV